MSEFNPGDVVQVRVGGGQPVRYILTSPSTGACEWHTAYNIDTGTVGMVQLLRVGGTTVRKLKKTEGLIAEVKDVMTAHMNNYASRHNHVSSLL